MQDGEMKRAVCEKKKAAKNVPAAKKKKTMLDAGVQWL
jgi:hypothetical protein